MTSKNNNVNKLLEAALSYAGRGWRTLPLHSAAGGRCSCQRGEACTAAGKHPRERSWTQSASADPIAVRDWWTRWPGANVGVLMGPGSDLFALDADGDEGLAALGQLELAYSPLPPTPVFQTGGGGQQALFRWPSDGSIVTPGSRVDGLAIDVRGRGSQSVFPPSVSAKGPYYWLISPDLVGVAEAPPWLLNWLSCHGRIEGRPVANETADVFTGLTCGNGQRPSVEDRARAYMNKCPPAISGQGGHAAMFRVARALTKGFLLSEEVALRLLTEFNQCCEPRWSEAELTHKIKDAINKPFDRADGYLLGVKADHNGQALRDGHAKATPAAPYRDRPGHGLVTHRLSEFRMQPVRYLVPGYLPLGKLVLIAGQGGRGKSSLVNDLAAALTQGRPALGLQHEAPAASDVLLLSCEDDPADTIGPRLLAAGADLRRVHFVRGLEGDNGKVLPFSLLHYESLRTELVRRPEVRLVSIDPAGGFLGGTDEHKDGDLRQLLGPLAELAAERSVTILLVKHLNKSADLRAVNRVTGSVAWTNACRAAFLVADDPDDESRRLLLPMKCNLGVPPLGRVFRLAGLGDDEAKSLLAHHDLPEGDREALARQLFKVEWVGNTDAKADDVLASRRGEKASKVQLAAAWIREFMAGLAWPDDEVEAASTKAGHSVSNFRRAKTLLREEGLRAQKRGFAGHWWIGFGPPETWTDRTAQSFCVSPLGHPKNEHNDQNDQFEESF